MKVLKIDVEGAEYDIFADLHEHGLLKEFDLIIGEYHKGLEPLLEYLSDFNRSYKEASIKKGIGTMVFVNKRYKIC